MQLTCPVSGHFCLGGVEGVLSVVYVLSGFIVVRNWWFGVGT